MERKACWQKVYSEAIYSGTQIDVVVNIEYRASQSFFSSPAQAWVTGTASRHGRRCLVSFPAFSPPLHWAVSLLHVCDRVRCGIEQETSEKEKHEPSYFNRSSSTMSFLFLLSKVHTEGSDIHQIWEWRRAPRRRPETLETPQLCSDPSAETHISHPAHIQYYFISTEIRVRFYVHNQNKG